MKNNIPIRYWYMDRTIDSSNIDIIYEMYLMQKGININISDFEMKIAKELGKQLAIAFTMPINSKKNKRK